MKKNSLKESKTNFNTPSNLKVAERKTRFGVFASRLKRKIFKHVWFVRISIIIFTLCLMTGIFLILGSRFKNSKYFQYLTLSSDFIFAPTEKVKSFRDRTNVIILGKGGGGHEAPDLTDTIIVFSITHSDKKSTLVSLPRDIWIPELRTKLNSIYYWGNQKESGGGLKLAKTTIEEMVGLPIHYALVFDFNSFKKVIDVLSGVEVDAANSFVDERYPISGKEDDLCGGDPEFKCRYETIRFNGGKQLMDGEIALKFVRSRNATGDEGTDFAREARQQKVIEGMKNKIMSRDFLLSPKRILSLKDIFVSDTETDMNLSELAILGRRVFDSRKNTRSYVLPEEFLIHPQKSQKYDNLYVFRPRKDDWSEVHGWVECVLEKKECE